MATKKITDLTAASSAALSDLLPIVDMTGPTTKKATVSQLLANIVATENNALAGSQNNVVLTTASTVPITFVRYTDAGAGTWTGIAGGSSGRILILTVTDPIGSLTINCEDAASSAANRATFPGAANIWLQPQNVALLIYDATTSRWRGGIL